MTNEHMKRCSTLLANGEMQIKTIRRYYLTPTRMVIIKKIIYVCEVVEKLESLYITGRKVKQCSHFGKQSGSYSKS